MLVEVVQHHLRHLAPAQLVPSVLMIACENLALAALLAEVLVHR